MPYLRRREVILDGEKKSIRVVHEESSQHEEFSGRIDLFRRKDNHILVQATIPFWGERPHE